MEREVDGEGGIAVEECFANKCCGAKCLWTSMEHWAGLHAGKSGKGKGKGKGKRKKETGFHVDGIRHFCFSFVCFSAFFYMEL